MSLLRVVARVPMTSRPAGSADAAGDGPSSAVRAGAAPHPHPLPAKSGERAAGHYRHPLIPGAIAGLGRRCRYAHLLLRVPFMGRRAQLSLPLPVLHGERGGPAPARPGVTGRLVGQRVERGRTIVRGRPVLSGNPTLGARVAGAPPFCRGRGADVRSLQPAAVARSAIARSFAGFQAEHVLYQGKIVGLPVDKGHAALARGRWRVLGAHDVHKSSL